HGAVVLQRLLVRHPLRGWSGLDPLDKIRNLGPFLLRVFLITEQSTEQGIHRATCLSLSEPSWPSCRCRCPSKSGASATEHWHATCGPMATPNLPWSGADILSA